MTSYQMAQGDSHRKSHTMTTEYVFCLVAHGPFFKVDQTLGHKISLNKYKKIEITSYILSEHCGSKPISLTKENQKEYKTTEAEQHNTEPKLDGGNQEKIWNFFVIVNYEIKTKYTEIYRTP